MLTDAVIQSLRAKDPEAWSRVLHRFQLDQVPPDAAAAMALVGNDSVNDVLKWSRASARASKPPRSTSEDALKRWLEESLTRDESRGRWLSRFAKLHDRWTDPAAMEAARKLRQMLAEQDPPRGLREHSALLAFSCSFAAGDFEGADEHAREALVWAEAAEPPNPERIAFARQQRMFAQLGREHVSEALATLGTLPKGPPRYAPIVSYVSQTPEPGWTAGVRSAARTLSELGVHPDEERPRTYAATALGLLAERAPTDEDAERLFALFEQRVEEIMVDSENPTLAGIQIHQACLPRGREPLHECAYRALQVRLRIDPEDERAVGLLGVFETLGGLSALSRRLRTDFDGAIAELDERLQSLEEKGELGVGQRDGYPRRLVNMMVDALGPRDPVRAIAIRRRVVEQLDGRPPFGPPRWNAQLELARTMHQWGDQAKALAELRRLVDLMRVHRADAPALVVVEEQLEDWS